MKQASFFLIWFALALALSSTLLPRVQSSVHRYSNGQFAVSQNGFLFYGGSEGMHASTSDATTGGVSNGRSYIRFDSIKFKRPAKPTTGQFGSESVNGLVQVIIFEVSDREKVGGTDAICCTSDLANSEGCKEGQVIIRPSLEDANWPFSIPIYFKGDLLEASMQMESVNITKTGFYNVFFVFCDPQLEGLIIDGTSIWKNPTGYLPGSMTPLLTFYGMISLAYILLGLAWFLQSLRFWKDMLKLQNHLTIIIALGMLEVTLWYFEYANFNATGHRPIGITVWAVTFGAVKKALSRLLILAVSMGYGVVRPTLGAQTSKVVVLGVTYFLAAEALDIFENVGTINDLSGKAKLLLVLPVAVLDAAFILWIFVSLSKILEKLQEKKWVAKLEIYRKLTNTLSVCVVIAVAWIGYEFYFKTTDPFGEQWQRAWIISAFWNILTFLLLCVLCFLWAPSQNSAKYEYSDETAENFDEEEAVPLKSILTVEPEKNTLKLEKKERKPVNGNAFVLDDGPEEDKRE